MSPHNQSRVQHSTKIPTKSVFLAYTPFTGLGLYNGFRGNRWLRNRIKIFKQFVIPSLQNQSDRNFIHWVSWRPEERNNPYVIELAEYMNLLPNYQFVFTFSGLCFWDDKYKDDVAWDRLVTSLQGAMPDLFEVVNTSDEVVMLIQPSDDLYQRSVVQRIKDTLASDKTLGAVSYIAGYHCNYLTKEVREYNPTTNPPFFAIRFPREIFVDPVAHMKYTGPYKSHEYIGDKLKLWHLYDRGFMVGSHTENISTHFNHPFTGRDVIKDNEDILDSFGIWRSPVLELPKSWRKELMRKLPYEWQKRLRYLLGESLFGRLYSFIRN